MTKPVRSQAERQHIERYLESLKARTRAMTRKQLEAVVAKLKGKST